MSRRNATMDAFRGAFEEGYVQGAHHSRGASLILEAQRISMAYWERVREEAEAKFPSPVSASVPSREAGPGTPLDEELDEEMLTDAEWWDRHRAEIDRRKSAAAPLASPDDVLAQAEAERYSWCHVADSESVPVAAYRRLDALVAALRSSLQEARADSERLTELQALNGRRRVVQIQTTSTGTTIEQADEEGDFSVVGRGPGLRDAIDALAAVRAALLVEREESRR
jgi:hypothetical protein